MQSRIRDARTCLAALLLLAAGQPAAAQKGSGPAEESVRLWPGQAPGTERWTGQETDKVNPTGPFGPIRAKGNVTVPTLTVVRPPHGKANGTAVIVLPGGAFQILAWDIEGTEVARRLAEQGMTAYLLKYRVRAGQLDPGKPAPAAMMEALQSLRKIAIADAAQAVRIVRQRAKSDGIRTERVGMMGFSAGAIATLGLLLEGDPTARPNFAAVIYGTPLMEKPVVPADSPPIFIASAQDDFLSAGSVETYKLWTDAKRPAELHIYDKGGHGFGMRAKDLPVGSWPQAFETWLANKAFLPARPLRP